MLRAVTKHQPCTGDPSQSNPPFILEHVAAAGHDCSAKQQTSQHISKEVVLVMVFCGVPVRAGTCVCVCVCRVCLCLSLSRTRCDRSG